MAFEERPVEEIMDFIKKTNEFDKNGDLTNFFMRGYCYYYALMLQERFGGELVYDEILGHFYCLIDGNLCDFTGCTPLKPEISRGLSRKDEWAKRKTIIDGCILKKESGED